MQSKRAMRRWRGRLREQRRKTGASAIAKASRALEVALRIPEAVTVFQSFGRGGFGFVRSAGGIYLGVGDAFIRSSDGPIGGVSAAEAAAALERVGNVGFWFARGDADTYRSPEPEAPQPKASPCDGCANYHGHGYGHATLHCAMHPYGPEGEQCEDWEAKPEPSAGRRWNEATELWEAVWDARWNEPSLRPLYYRLEGRTPVPSERALNWDESWRVAETFVGDVRISTVFLGRDWNWAGGLGPAIVFETMVFGGPHDEWHEGYATWEQAEAGHREAVAMVEGPDRRAGFEPWQQSYHDFFERYWPSR